jgi:hypothetical protein
MQEILADLHAAERELQGYEKKYGLRSEYFYDCFQAGLIEDNGNFDFQVWAGLCEAKHDLERRYKEMILLQKPFRESVKTLIANGVVSE